MEVRTRGGVGAGALEQRTPEGQWRTVLALRAAGAELTSPALKLFSLAPTIIVRIQQLLL